MNLPNMLEAKKRDKSKKIENYSYREVSIDKSLVGKKFFVRTYGCQMNEHDGERVKGILSSQGLIETDSLEDAHIVILNTCAIRENAHDKVFGFMGLIKKMKETKDILMGICGCMAQEESVVNEIKSKYKYVDFVFGTHNLDEMISVINERVSSGKQVLEIYSTLGSICEGIPEVRDSKYTAWVDIILGCDKFCTYCIVPYTRGTQRSRRYEDVIEEVKGLKSIGYKEVTLLGQNVNAYGKDLYSDYNLANLLKDVSDTGIERIRFVTSHPWDFTDEMIDVISRCDNVMPYVHLPIQSGSDRILKLMGRKYSVSEYLELYEKIRSKVKGVSITTDIIVGFPGETDEDFECTLEVVNKCKFDGAFTFVFSPREGTPASKLDDNTSLEVKNKRLYKLNELINMYSNEANQRCVNEIHKCLVLGKSEKDDSKYMGYTENMKLVNIVSDEDIVGKIVEVRIDEAKSFSLNGTYVK
jgi:tRNA-2-methylthio-N6-dimethylallyladenosine synthase